MYISLLKKTDLIHLPRRNTNCFSSRLFAMYSIRAKTPFKLSLLSVNSGAQLKQLRMPRTGIISRSPSYIRLIILYH